MGLREIMIGGCSVEDIVEDCLADELGGNRISASSLELVVIDDNF